MKFAIAIATATLIAVSAKARAAEPLSPHGYFGREGPTTQAIRIYLLGRDFARDIQ